MPLTYPTEPVEIVLADHKPRYLRYTAATVRRLKARLGRSLMGGFGALDEDSLPEAIYEGLTDKSSAKVKLTGQDAADHNIPDGSELVGPDAVAFLMPMPSVQYVLERFCLAWTGALPVVPADTGRPPVPASPEN